MIRCCSHRFRRFGPSETVGKLCRVVLVGIACGAIGCSRGSKDKVVVEGQVTFAGKRITNGDIRFFPKPGFAGRATGNAIVDGRYRIDRHGGVPVGEHTVVIRAFILEGVATADQRSKGATPDLVSDPVRQTKQEFQQFLADGRWNYLPPYCNQASTLMATVSGEEDPQMVDFELE